MGHAERCLKNGIAPVGRQAQSALKYRAQAPLIDSLLKELGLGGVDPASLSQALASDAFRANGAGANGEARAKPAAKVRPPKPADGR